MNPAELLPSSTMARVGSSWLALALMAFTWLCMPMTLGKADSPPPKLSAPKAAVAAPSRPSKAVRANALADRASYPYAGEIQAIAKKYQIAPELIASIVRLESNFDRYCLSPVGAAGLMQLMPETAQDMAKDLGLRHYDVWDPKTNLELGTRYLTILLRTFHGQLPAALSFYNAGRFGMVSRGVYRNHRYIRVVMDNYWDYLRAQPQEISFPSAAGRAR